MAGGGGFFRMAEPGEKSRAQLRITIVTRTFILHMQRALYRAFGWKPLYLQCLVNQHLLAEVTISLTM